MVLMYKCKDMRSDNVYIPAELNDFELPREVEKDSDYLEDLETYLAKYYEHVCNKLSNYSESVKGIEENINLIKKCLTDYYNGRLSEAYDSIKKILKKYADGDNMTQFIVATIDDNYAFRGSAPKGIRTKIYSGTEYDKTYEKMLDHKLTFFKARVDSKTIAGKDMLHIPFDKRELISTQRFSIPGIPCIYLSTSSYGTWIEMGYPESSQFQVSSIELPKDIRVLNLCMHQFLIDGMTSLIGNREEEKQAKACLEIFPLVIATSYRVKQNDRKFKSEYIISQIVMQVCGEIGIDGVAYLSKRTKDIYAYPQAVNLAIAIPNNCKAQYWERANEIRLTEPIRFIDFLSKGIRNQGVNQEFLSYVNEIYKGNYSKKVYLGDIEIEYIKTDYSAFDEYILKQKFISYTEL